MKKWKAVKVKQELVDQVEKEIQRSEYKNLSEFVSDAIQQQLQTITKQRISEYLERDKAVKSPQEQFYYTPNHIWARMTNEGTVEIGVTESFQTRVKEIVNIQTDIVGEFISKNTPFGVAESWWFTYDLYAPLNGRITQINNEVIGDPFILNADQSRWIVKIQPEVEEVNSWMKDLLTEQGYQKLAYK